MRRIWMMFLPLFIVSFCMLSVSADTIGTPVNLQWIDGSQATASWDAVDTANYYEVTVKVYHNGDYVGETVTGTTETKLDVQQEIHNIAGDKEYIAVDVSFAVKAIKREENGDEIAGNRSEYSPESTYYFKNKVQLDTPANIEISDDLVLSMDLVDHAGKYGFHLSVLGKYGSGGYDCYIDDINGEIRDGRIYYDLTPMVDKLCKQYACYFANGNAQINAYYFQSYPENEKEYVKSKNDDPFQIHFTYDTPQRKQLNAPSGVELSDDYILSFPAVEHADEYYAIVERIYEGRSICNHVSCKASDAVANDGRVYIDIKPIIKDLLNSFELPEGTVPLTVKEIYAAPASYDTYYRSDNSEEEITFDYGVSARPKLKAPANIRMDGNNIISMDLVDHAKCYLIDWEFQSRDGKYQDRCEWAAALKQGTVKDGRVYFDMNQPMWDILKKDKTHFGCTELNGIITQVRSSPETYEKYETSDAVNVNLPFTYLWDSNVKEIRIDPQQPVLCLDHSTYLGKNIKPIEANYSSIQWSSSDPCVTVDKNGKITANALGKANITAKIGAAEDTVTVQVYKMESNLKDAGEKETLIDDAGSIIDDIVNNEDPNLNKTDIPESKLDKIKDDIIESIGNGDKFYTDVNWFEENFVKYKENWGQIQKAARDCNAKFAGAYTFEVELYHKDSDKEKHHIGNIIQLDDEVTFTFDLPTGMKEIESEDTKKYVLVRIHINRDGSKEYTPIDYTVNPDGTFSVSTRKFSELVFLERDQKDICALYGHHYVTKITKATFAKNGSRKTYCDLCGKVKTTKKIPKAAVKVGSKGCTFDGKKHKPAITIKGLKKGTDYSVKNLKSKKSAGVYKYKVVLKGTRYSGSKSFTYTIRPMGTKVTKVTGGKKCLTVKWAKKSKKMAVKRINGYKVQIATDSKFKKNVKTFKVEKYSKTSKKITKLKAKKKYYVRVCTYMVKDGKTITSKWSKVKSVKTK